MINSDIFLLKKSLPFRIQISHLYSFSAVTSKNVLFYHIFIFYSKYLHKVQLCYEAFMIIYS